MWKEDIQNKLIEKFKNKPEGLARVFYYLDEEDRVYENDPTVIPPAWRTLRTSLDVDAVFVKYAEKLIEDTKQLEKDPKFRKVMADFYSRLLDNKSDHNFEEDFLQGVTLERMVMNDSTYVCGFAGLARAWSKIPAESQVEIFKIIPYIVKNSQVVEYAGKLL